MNTIREILSNTEFESLIDSIENSGIKTIEDFDELVKKQQLSKMLIEFGLDNVRISNFIFIIATAKGKMMIGTSLLIATTVLYFFVFVLSFPNSNSSNSGETSYSNNEGLIRHFTGKDYDRNAMYRKIGEDVWDFVQNYPDANKLKLIIIDECKDSKGNISNYETTILFNKLELKEFLTYKDEFSFNKNCYELGAKLLDWHPCGNSPY